MRALLGVVAVCGLGCVGSQVQVLTSLTPVDASRPYFILEAKTGDACGANAVVRAVEDLYRFEAKALDFGAPNSVPVHASSLGFDAANADQALKALVAQVNGWTTQNQWISSPIGMRWVKASQDFLSPQYGRDTIMLEVPIMKGTPNATETLDRYATYMMDVWGGRPHWGQQNPMGKQRFQNVYGDAVPRFLSAYRTLNPNGFFDGPLARQLGLRDLANVL